VAKRKSDLHERVRLRAAERCEYCQLPQQYDPLPFHVEHIISKKHRGRSTTGNLALSCGSCNLHKSSNIAGLDAATGKLTRLFNPRRDVWHEHFSWEGPTLVGITSVGRTTVDVLYVNNPERQRLRSLLIKLGVFPPRTIRTKKDST
jgi:hypothetical protein